MAVHMHFTQRGSDRGKEHFSHNKPILTAYSKLLLTSVKSWQPFIRRNALVSAGYSKMGNILGGLFVSPQSLLIHINSEKSTIFSEKGGRQFQAGHGAVDIHIQT